MPDSMIPKSPGDAQYAEQQESRLNWLDMTDPFLLFEQWYAEARETEPTDTHAMSVATVDEAGLPDVRIVLLKGVDERGFVFYTNSESAKGTQLQKNSKAALCFHWKSQNRQIRIRGAVDRVSEAESDAYFASRVRGSQVGAWASDQSREVADKETLLAGVREMEARFEGRDIPRPPHWFGWRVAPQFIEFWQNGAYRVHDRIQFEQIKGGWTKRRLFP